MVYDYTTMHPWRDGDIIEYFVLGSKTLGSKCIRTLMCNVDRPWSKHLV